MNQQKTKHGFAGTPLYQCWVDIKHRCSNPKYRDYHRYGGRGIAVCNQWELFIPFKDWALLNGYKHGLEIDRIDNDGDYTPSNCRWVTRRQNSMNRTHKKEWGVYRNGKYLWAVRITRNRKQIYIGTYKTIKEAMIARDNFIYNFDKHLLVHN